MQKTMTACLVALALGVVTAEARADGGRWVMAEDGTWIETAPATPDGTAPPPPAGVDREPPVGVWSPPETRARAASAWSGPAPDDVERHAEDDDADEPPMRSGRGFAGGVVLTAVGGSLMVGAALSTIPVGYEGNGSGDPGSEVAAIALIGAAATAGGIGLILWSRAPASGPGTTLSVGPGDVRLRGSF